MREVPRAPPLIDAVAAVALVAGAAGVHLLPRLPAIDLATVVALVAIALAVWVRAAWSRLLAWSAIGALATTLAGTHALAQRWPLSRDGEDVTAVVTVTGLPEAFDRGWRFDATVLPAAPDATPVAARLSWYTADAAPTPGTRLDATARLRSPRGTRNPGAFDFEQYAVARGIAATGYLRSATRQPAPATGHGVAQLRHSLASTITNTLGDSRAGALVRALTLGDQAGIADAEWHVVRVTGIAHLIAISGFHVATVAACGMVLPWLLLRSFPALTLRWPRRVWLRTGVLLAATGYGLLAGGAVPVSRTVAMIAIVALVSGWRRRIDVATVLALATVFIVLADPLVTLMPGFWLSFAGVAWLVYALGGRSPEPAWRSYLRAQAVMALALAPLVVLMFQQVSLAGAVVNLVAVPWFGLVLVPVALVGTALAWCGVPGGETVLRGGGWLAEETWRAADWAATWPVASMPLADPGIVAVLLATMGVALLLLPRGMPRAFGLLLLVPMVVARPETPRPGEVVIEAIDVGQGLAVLVRTTNHALLYDAGAAAPGRLDRGESAVVPVLIARQAAPDRIVISHGDNDHAGGLAAVLRHRRAPVLAGPDVPAALLGAGPATGIDRRDDGHGGDGAAVAGIDPLVTCTTGQHWKWDGIAFTVLHPPPHFPALGNDSSCVIRIDGPHGSALIAGDIGADIESRLATMPARLRADVVVAPHHGSAKSASPAFVVAILPRVVLVSAGWGNPYGHPAPSATARWQAAGATVRNTAADGLLSVTLAAGGPAIRAERRIHPRWWQSR